MMTRINPFVCSEGGSMVAICRKLPV